MSSRSLAIEEVGDFARRRTAPYIRLRGRWLQQAGFRPGSRVTVTVTTHGQLVLTSEDLQRPALSPELEADRQRIVSRLAA
jgi:hypothetical protein